VFALDELLEDEELDLLLEDEEEYDGVYELDWLWEPELSWLSSLLISLSV